MNDINDKLIDGLEEAKKKIDKLKEQLKEKDRLINHHREVYDGKQGEITDKDQQIKELVGTKNRLVDELKELNGLHCFPKVTIVNDMLESMNADVGPDKVILISEVMFAFVKDSDGIALWSKTEDNDWVEVSDLTELKVWEYQEIKSYAIAVGMIKEDEDLFI